MPLSPATPRASAIASPVANRQLEIPVPEALRVLLVEDDKESAALVSVHLTGLRDDGFQGRRFQDDGFQIEWIPELLDAMFRLQHAGVDVVLLDLGFPGIGGDRTFRAINGMTEGKIPIVILTSDDRPGSRELILASGAAGYLTKQEVSGWALRLALRNAVLRFGSGTA